MSDPARDPNLQRRAAVFAALGDPHRLAIVEALALTDASPSDLEVRLGIPSNLLAHHLDALEAVGLVRRTRSAGDGRRRYVQLSAVASAHRLRPASIEAADVLFVCRHNSARSQFAAACWNEHSSIPAESAGTRPAACVHPMAVQASAQRGLDLSGRAPRGYDELRRAPGLVISVCDLAFEEADPFIGVQHLHWSVSDPAARSERGAFDAAFDEIAQRIDRLVPAVVAPIT
ncbi:MAG: helix-turn-helix domain-containing protein [Ardenticatenales bacterium]|nr:helix-turn-helix domain-containing protein [Ardenticatenales bacterium]